MLKSVSRYFLRDRVYLPVYQICQVYLLYFLKLKLFGNSWGNSYTKFAIVDIKFRFTCGESDLYQIIVKFQNIKTSIVGIYVKTSWFLLHNLLQVCNHKLVRWTHAFKLLGFYEKCYTVVSFKLAPINVNNFNLSLLSGLAFSKPSYKVLTGPISKWSSAGDKSLLIFASK